MREIEGVVRALFRVNFYMGGMIQGVENHLTVVFCVSTLNKKFIDHLILV